MLDSDFAHNCDAPMPSEATEAETHQLMEQMIEYAPTGMVVLDAETLQVKLANRVVRGLYEQYSQRPASMLYGQRVQELYSWPQAYDALKQLEHVAQSGVPVYNQLLEVRANREAADATDRSSSHPSDMCWAYDIVPLGMAKRPIENILVTLRDCTLQIRERKRAEAATFSAQLRTEMLEAIIEQIAEAVIVRDREGKLVVYNREALAFASNRAEVERARARGNRVLPEWEMLDGNGNLLRKPELPEWRVMLTGVSLLSDDVLVHKENGATLPVLIHAAPLRDEMGTITGAVIAFQDISTVKEEERLKDELTSVASHELRQPITVIQGQAQMLKRHLRRFADDESQPINSDALRKLADGVESQTTRLNLLVSDLLDMSRIQAGQLRLNPARAELVPLVARLVDLQREATNDHQFVLDNQVPPQYGNLEGIWDANRIEQLLANLLNNAVKYSPTGGEIRVTLNVLPRGTHLDSKEHGRRRLTVEHAHLAIKDQGIGIPSDGLRHLFERFYRAPNTGGFQGTGLGLYICQQVAQMHHGTLWVESNGIGNGSTFHLALPLK